MMIGSRLKHSPNTYFIFITLVRTSANISKDQETLILAIIFEYITFTYKICQLKRGFLKCLLFQELLLVKVATESTYLLYQKHIFYFSLVKFCLRLRLSKYQMFLDHVGHEQRKSNTNRISSNDHFEWVLVSINIYF